MTRNVTAHLRFKPASTSEHMLLNLRNFNFFRRSDSGKAIMVFGEHRLPTWLIAIPYVVLSEFFFLRSVRYYVTLKNQIVGIVVVHEESENLYVNSLAVAPEYRGNGIANAMIVFCSTIALRMHKSWLELSVLKVNTPARRLYKKAGFKFEKSRRWSLILRRKVY
jgi:ribosomal protein S18 acetylase RimI-like enzyme